MLGWCFPLCPKVSIFYRWVQKKDFFEIYNRLLEPHAHNPADPYFVLKDLPDYIQCQHKVENLYTQPNKWAEYALHNIACMGNFSTDHSIHTYAKNIWGLSPCPPSTKILEKVREEYAEHDRSRII